MAICTNRKKKGHTIENCWSKGGGKEGQGPKQKKCFKTKKQKGKAKANTAEETSEDDEDEQLIAFMNFNCAALIKDNSGMTQILDTGASTHMTPHKNLLADYKNSQNQGKCTWPIKVHLKP